MVITDWKVPLANSLASNSGSAEADETDCVVAPLSVAQRTLSNHSTLVTSSSKSSAYFLRTYNLKTIISNVLILSPFDTLDRLAV